MRIVTENEDFEVSAILIGNGETVDRDCLPTLPTARNHPWDAMAFPHMARQ